MIKPGATLQVERIALHKLQIREYQTRYPDRLTHYINLMSTNPGDPGVICVKPQPGGAYEVLDGHHRFCAMIMTGRAEALCLVINETTEEQQ